MMALVAFNVVLQSFCNNRYIILPPTSFQFRIPHISPVYGACANYMGAYFLSCGMFCLTLTAFVCSLHFHCDVWFRIVFTVYGKNIWSFDLRKNY